MFIPCFVMPYFYHFSFAFVFIGKRVFATLL